MPSDEIRALSDRIVDALGPVAVYLFGSYANGSQGPDSDVDIYVVMPDGTDDLPAASTRAYRALRGVRKRPVDVVVGTQSRFVRRAALPSIEHEVRERGVLLYG